MPSVVTCSRVSMYLRNVERRRPQLQAVRCPLPVSPSARFRDGCSSTLLSFNVHRDRIESRTTLHVTSGARVVQNSRKSREPQSFDLVLSKRQPKVNVIKLTI